MLEDVAEIDTWHRGVRGWRGEEREGKPALLTMTPNTQREGWNADMTRERRKWAIASLLVTGALAAVFAVMRRPAEAPTSPAASDSSPPVQFAGAVRDTAGRPIGNAVVRAVWIASDRAPNEIRRRRARTRLRGVGPVGRDDHDRTLVRGSTTATVPTAELTTSVRRGN